MRTTLPGGTYMTRKGEGFGAKGSAEGDPFFAGQKSIALGSSIGRSRYA